MQAPSSLPINYAIFSPLASQPQPHAIPLISFRMPAGFPSQADGYIEDGLDLNEYLAPNGGACFMFTIDGDSLKNAGILHGDKVVVDRSKDVRNGCIVIAEIDYEYTAKFFFKRSNRIELHPANPEFQSIVISMEQELRIWGVVVGALRRYV